MLVNVKPKYLERQLQNNRFLRKLRCSTSYEIKSWEFNTIMQMYISTEDKNL